MTLKIAIKFLALLMAIFGFYTGYSVYQMIGQAMDFHSTQAITITLVASLLFSSLAIVSIRGAICLGKGK